MLLKWIRCTVPDAKRPAFSATQAKWASIANADGFYAQVGGWDASRPGQACIVGLWRDQAAYQHFMDDLHDQVFHSNHQALTYTDIQTGIYDTLYDVSHSGEDIGQIVDRAQWITVFRWSVQQDIRTDFERFLHDEWKPALEDTSIMLAAQVARQSGLSGDYLVALIWHQEQDFQQAIMRSLPILLQRTQSYSEGLLYSFSLLPQWKVIAT